MKQRFVVLCLVCSTFAGCSLLRILTDPIEDPPASEWSGLWRLESVDGKSIDAQLAADGIVVSVSNNLWSFKPDGSFFASPVFTISNAFGGTIITLSQEISGTYFLNGDRYSLITSVGFLIDFGFGTPDGDAGRWVLVGDKLVLTSDEGGRIVIFVQAEHKGDMSVN